jgi:hypothetical protein
LIARQREEGSSGCPSRQHLGIQPSISTAPQAIAAYLDAALEEGEAALIAATIGDVARAPRQEAIARSARAEASSQTGEMKELDDVR